MALKVLALGDIHLGRRPPLPEGELDSSRLGPTAAWERTLEEALRIGVDALLMAGDVVEREDDFFEAYRFLASGVRRLVEAGVAVVAVAGNHDGLVLPRLAAEMEGFRLLGAEGRWESICLSGGGESLTLWGRSMTGGSCRVNPLEGMTFDERGLSLGLLHCDVDGGNSPYAPVPRRDLERSGLDGWLLGHVHRPDALSAPNPLGYLGSLTGLDVGETGPRGPWFLSVEGGRLAVVEQWPLAPLRWERLDVDLTGLSEVEEARSRLLAQIGRLDGAVTSSAWAPEALGLRLLLRGATALGGAARRLLASDERQVLHEGARGTCYFLESVRSLTTPERDLALLARLPDLPGLLARRLLALDDSDEGPRLVEGARCRLENLMSGAPWTALEGPPLDDGALTDSLRAVGLNLLEELLAQREAES